MYTSLHNIDSAKPIAIYHGQTFYLDWTTASDPSVTFSFLSQRVCGFTHKITCKA